MGTVGRTDIERYRAPSALARKRPATTTPLVRRERWAAGYLHKHAMMTEARKQERAGLVRVCQRDPVWSRERGQWELTVERIRPGMSQRVKRLLIAGVVVGILFALGAVGAWAYATLAAIPGALLLVLILALFALYVAVGQRQSRRGVTEVLVSVVVRRR